MSKYNIKLTPYEDLFETDESRAENKLEKVRLLPISELKDFPNHPFRVVNDDELLQIMQSIKEGGILTPIIGREVDNGVEIISGHRRKLACELLGIDTLPVIVREMSDEQAIITMVNSNLQREHILPSEKAFAYKMKMEALSRQGERTDLTSCQVGTKLRSDDIVAKSSDDSARQVQRYIRLTNLIPELLEKVDCRQIAFSPAVELSYLEHSQQQSLLRSIERNDSTPSLSQAQRLKRLSAEGTLDEDTIDVMLGEEKPNQKEHIKLPVERLQKYFPQRYTQQQMEKVIEKLLSDWARRRSIAERNER